MLDSYTNVNMSGDVDSSKSIFEYLLSFSGGALSMQSRLQKCFAPLIVEVGYIDDIEGGKDLLWMKNFLK